MALFNPAAVLAHRIASKEEELFDLFREAGCYARLDVQWADGSHRSHQVGIKRETKNAEGNVSGEKR